MIFFRYSSNSECLYISGDHSVVWRKGHEVLTAAGLLLSRDPRYKLHKNDFSLELQNIRPNDAGDFVCQLSTLEEAMEIAHTVEVLGTFACISDYLFFKNRLCTSLS